MSVPLMADTPPAPAPDVSAQVSADITANPQNVDFIVSQAIKAHPDQAAAIIAAAIKADPTAAGAIATSAIIGLKQAGLSDADLAADVKIVTTASVTAVLADVPADQQGAAIASVVAGEITVDPTDAVSIAVTAVQAAPSFDSVIAQAATTAAPDQKDAIVAAIIGVEPGDKDAIIAAVAAGATGAIATSIQSSISNANTEFLALTGTTPPTPGGSGNGVNPTQPSPSA